MNENKFETYLCVSLMLTCFWAGHKTNDPEILYWEFIKDFGGMIFGIASLYIAFKALYMWRTQLTGTEKFQAIRELHRSLHELQQALEKYRHRSVAAIMSQNAPRDTEWKTVAGDQPKTEADLKHLLYRVQGDVEWLNNFLTHQEQSHIRALKSQVVLKIHAYIYTQQKAISNGLFNNSGESDAKSSVSELSNAVKMMRQQFANN